MNNNIFSGPVENAGLLPPGDPTYVFREADQQLLEFLQTSKNERKYLCYILAPRQMGKSSLIAKTTHELSESSQENLCVLINIQGYGLSKKQKIKEGTLYFNIALDIFKNVNPSSQHTVLNKELYNFWNEGQKGVLHTKKFESFITEKIFPKISQKKLIIFLDEIQDLVTSGVNNEFMGLIKSFKSNKSIQGRLIFVVLGVVKSSDLITDKDVALNIGKQIHLKPFSLNPLNQCNPLKDGLKCIASGENLKLVLQEIIKWTGGQPYLTQYLCYLVCENLKFSNQSSHDNITSQINNLVQQEIINNWRQKPDKHFCNIETRFQVEYLNENDSNLQEQIDTLNCYASLVLGKCRYDYYDPNNKSHMNLIISGLVIKDDDNKIKVANPIYERIFDVQWSKNIMESIKQKLSYKEEDMSNNELYDRDVYILVDRSFSMNKTDPDMDNTRWQMLAEEKLASDVWEILQNRQVNQQLKSISDKVSIYLFCDNREGLCFEIEKSDNSESIAKAINNIFEEESPYGSTFICPTLEVCFKDWLEHGRKNNRKAFIIIYTDGKLSDGKRFEKLIQEVCEKIENQNEIKIIVIGVGNEIKEKDNLEYWRKIDNNLQGNKDSQGRTCDIIVFDIIDQKPLTETLKKELNNNKNLI